MHCDCSHPSDEAMTPPLHDDSPAELIVRQQAAAPEQGKKKDRGGGARAAQPRQPHTTHAVVVCPFIVPYLV